MDCLPLKLNFRKANPLWCDSALDNKSRFGAILLSSHYCCLFLTTSYMINKKERTIQIWTIKEGYTVH